MASIPKADSGRWDPALSWQRELGATALQTVPMSLSSLDRRYLRGVQLHRHVAWRENTIFHFSGNRSRLRRATQHWLAIYSPEFRSLRFFWALIQAQGDLAELRLPCRMHRVNQTLGIWNEGLGKRCNDWWVRRAWWRRSGGGCSRRSTCLRRRRVRGARLPGLQRYKMVFRRAARLW
jgi:hypothetical protein